MGRAIQTTSFYQFSPVLSIFKTLKNWNIIFEKPLLLPKHVGIVLSSMTQTRESWDSQLFNELKMPWHSVFSFLLLFFYIFIIFLFRTNAKKRYLDENVLCDCLGSFFGKAIPKVTWSQPCSKFLLNKLEVQWQQHFEGHPTVEDFTC